MECLHRHDFLVEALCGTVVDALPVGGSAGHFGDADPPSRSRGADSSEVWMIGTPGIRLVDPPHVTATVGEVPITALRRDLRRNTPIEPGEAAEFLSLLDRTLDRFRPDVLVTYGGDALTLEILARARRAGAVTIFTLHNFGYPDPAHFVDVDALLVPSRFSAEHHRRILGIDCATLPYLVDRSRISVDRADPRYVTFVNASSPKGVYPFVRIADELGRRRPDIPFLVVESRGSEVDLVSCGIDLRPHGNVFLMAQTSDPRDFWRVTKVALMPSLWWENQPLVAVEAMINGIPVIGSDRGGIPEALGGSGVVLPLPDRLTPTTRDLPTAEEVAPWVDAIIRLWDDAEWYAEQSRLALTEARRWEPEVLEPQYVRFFEGLQARVCR